MTELNRRLFLGGTLATAALLARAQGNAPARTDADGTETAPFPKRTYDRKLRVGLIGGGHRGNVVADEMLNHGGYEIASVCDYFPAVAAEMGKTFKVPASRQFTGLNGCKRMIEAGGIDVLAVLDVPYFYPDQIKDGVAAGLHIYVAKPIAVDVPGTLAIGKLGKAATQKGLCVRVDYQLPEDPANSEVITRMKAGALGKLSYLMTTGKVGLFEDPPFTGGNIACRFRNQIWLSDIALSGDIAVSFDIHIVDGIWVAMGGKMPVQATGKSNIRRAAHGDRIDGCGIIYEFDDGTFWLHQTQCLKNNADFTELVGTFYGTEASSRICYWGKSYVRGGENNYFVKDVSNTIYRDGIIRNVIALYDDIANKRVGNETVERAVQGNLICILGRDASERGKPLTMDELLRENRERTISLKGLTV